MPALPFCEDSVKAREDLPEPETPVKTIQTMRQFQTNILQVVLPSSRGCEWYFDCSGWSWWDDRLRIQLAGRLKCRHGEAWGRANSS